MACKSGFWKKNKTLFYAFVNLEKLFNRVPREVVTLSALRKLGFIKWLVKGALTIYDNARTGLKTKHANR